MQLRIGVVIQSRDGAAQGLRRCVDLARRIDAQLHVIDITEPAAHWLSLHHTQRGGDEEHLRGRRAILERFVGHVRSGGVEVSVAARRGRRIVELINEIREASIDLLVIVADDARQSPTTAEAFVNRVVRKAPVPVLVLRPLEHGSAGTVVALDISITDESGLIVESVARQAIAVASDLAPTLFLKVLELPDDALWDGIELDEFANDASDASRQRLEELASSIEPTRPVTIEVRVGQPAAEIESLVRLRSPELLVLGTVSDADQPGLMLGNTAEALLRSATCSVLLVKPVGFVSPLC